MKASQKHPIYALKRQLADRWRIQSEVRTIDGNTMLFVSWTTLSGASRFIQDCLPEFIQEGYTHQLLRMAGLWFIVIGKAKREPITKYLLH